MLCLFSKKLTHCIINVIKYINKYKIINQPVLYMHNKVTQFLLFDIWRDHIFVELIYWQCIR